MPLDESCICEPVVANPVPLPGEVAGKYNPTYCAETTAEVVETITHNNGWPIK